MLFLLWALQVDFVTFIRVDALITIIVLGPLVGPLLSIILSVIALFKKNEKNMMAIFGLIFSLVLIAINLPKFII